MYRMLIVDDEKNERDCILYLLKNSGLPLEIREAEDGVAALALFCLLYTSPSPRDSH